MFTINHAVMGWAGWDVESGPLDPANHLQPAMLISLSAPKVYSIEY